MCPVEVNVPSPPQIVVRDRKPLLREIARHCARALCTAVPPQRSQAAEIAQMSAKPLLPRRRSCDERYGASEAAAAGLIAGAIGQVIGFPLDTLKVRTQLGHTKAAAPLMRGVAGPVITSGAVQSVNFAVYDFVRRSHGDAATDCEAPLGSVFLAGALGGLAISPMTCAISRVKILQQSGFAPGGRVGLASVVRETVARGGALKGLGLNATMESGRGFYMLFFALIKKHYVGAGSERDLALWKRTVAGGAAGILSWAIIYPMDVVKTIVQAQLPGAPDAQNARQVAARLLREGGIRRLYSGVTFNLLRAGPVAGVLLPLYDISLATLRSLRHAAGT